MNDYNDTSGFKLKLTKTHSYLAAHIQINEFLTFAKVRVEHAVKIGTIELQNIYPAMVAQTIYRGNTDLVVDKCSILCLSI